MPQLQIRFFSLPILDSAQLREHPFYSGRRAPRKWLAVITAQREELLSLMCFSLPGRLVPRTPLSLQGLH